MSCVAQGEGGLRSWDMLRNLDWVGDEDSISLDVGPKSGFGVEDAVGVAREQVESLVVA